MGENRVGLLWDISSWSGLFQGPQDPQEKSYRGEILSETTVREQLRRAFSSSLANRTGSAHANSLGLLCMSIRSMMTPLLYKSDVRSLVL